MLIPIGTNVKHLRYPTVTYVLIGLNLLVFAMQWSIQRAGGVEFGAETTNIISNGLNNARLSSGNFHVYSLITYQFLHAGWIHILGNMLFLLPFGKAVEDRLGHVGFAFFYLGCGAFGGYIHTIFSTAPVVGASGSVCAVTAAFIVLAPKTYIRVLLVFFIIGVYQIPSMLLVAFFVLFDVFSLLASMAGANAEPTAWIVHLGGYLSGFVITFSLLGLGILASKEFDLTQILKQAKRRHEYKRVMQKTTSPLLKDEKLSRSSMTRFEISELAATGNTIAAAEKYLLACKDNSKVKLNKELLNSLGNVLIRNGRIGEGVQVYEHYLTQQTDAQNTGEVALLLIAKYIRNLDNKDRAKELMNEYSGKFLNTHASLVATLTRELEI